MMYMIDAYVIECYRYLYIYIYILYIHRYYHYDISKPQLWKFDVFGEPQLPFSGATWPKSSPDAS